ncbi:MAG: hypothetical protein GY869_00405, partial [Planctomycetes bacterium]|nr:hypothetical protein [Planctomycetota bacterium]
LDNPVVGIGQQSITFVPLSENIDEFHPSSPTDENGQTYATVSTLVAEEVAFMAQIVLQGQTYEVTTDSLGFPAVVEFLPGPPDSLHSQLSPAQQDHVVGEESEITLTVKDEYDNPIPGLDPYYIEFTVSGTGNSNNHPLASQDTDENGVTFTTFWSTYAEIKIVTATIIDTMNDIVVEVAYPVEVNYLPGSVHDYNSHVWADPLEVIADGLSSSTITIQLRDGYFNPISGVNQNNIRIGVVECDSCRFNGFWSTETDENGEIENSLVSWEPQPLRIWVEYIPTELALADSPSVNFVENDISREYSTIDADPEIIVADSLDATTITLTVRNSNQTPVRNIQAAAIELMISGEQNYYIEELEGVTDEFGQIRATLVSTKAQEKVITATVSNIMVDDDAMVTFIPGDVAYQQSWMTASTPVTADGVDYSLVTIQFSDKYNNPIRFFGTDDDSLYLAATVTDTVGVNISQPQLPADIAGQTTARVTSTVQHSGENAVVLSAYLNNQPIAVPQYVEFFYEIDLLSSNVWIEPLRDIYANGSDSAVVYIDLRSSGNVAIPDVPIFISSNRNTSEIIVDMIEQPRVTDATGRTFGYVRSERENSSFLTVTAADTVELTNLLEVPFDRAPLTRFDSDSLYATPNPFTPDSDDENYNRTRINIPLSEHPEGGIVTIQIYDIGGALVKDLTADFDGQLGSYFVYWDGTDDNNDPAPSGVYIYQADISGTMVLNSIIGLAR